MYGAQSPNHQSPDGLQCAYVIVPNSPVQTYNFPPVTGVAETLQRTEDSLRRNDKGNNKTVSHPTLTDDHRGKNGTSLKMNEFGMTCNILFHKM